MLPSLGNLQSSSEIFGVLPSKSSARITAAPFLSFWALDVRMLQETDQALYCVGY